jgi:D-alanyl-lipoteichoic acid acyltransferase DltB (MBOAT superfamily)
MLFNSFEFLIFLPAVFGIHQLLPGGRGRLWLFLVASCVFYSFLIPAYLGILFFLIAVDFWTALRIQKSEDPSVRKGWLLLSLVSNIGMLAVFKYSNFFLSNLGAVAAAFDWNLPLPVLQWALPIGLSFHTFQSLSYVLEVYYRRFLAERSLLHYSVYVLYFPQLVAGPIERPQNILPQLHRERSFDARKFRTGLQLMAQGLFKKAVIADTLAPLANRVFDHPAEFGFLGTAAGILAFSFQIYCDFSGYSDIARGVSRLFGIELMENFKKPYFSTSFSEFWRRWHISLSTWFRDYVYIPLGGNRGSALKTRMNLLAVFLLSGFWHGANWTFLAWGLLHGFFLIHEHRFPPGISRFNRFKALQVFVFTSLAWVFFRASSLTTAFQTLGALGGAPLLGWSGIPAQEWQEATVAIALLLFLEWADDRVPVWGRLGALPPPLRRTIYAGILILFLLTAQFGGSQFIYFQF